MNNVLLIIHSFLRWIILLLLLIVIVQSFTSRSNMPVKGLQKTSLFLLIFAHLTLLIGLYQWFAGDWGYKLISENGFSEVMKNNVQRFWAVEHIGGMLVAIILITVARNRVKKLNFSAATWMYLIALVIILASIPWPFREGINRPWIRY